MKLALITTAFVALLVAESRADGLDAKVRQLVLSIAEDWESKSGQMQLFERDRGGTWKPAGSVVPILYGRSGVAWGRGEHGPTPGGPQKKERDGRTPAGLFRIGTIFGYNPSLPPGGDYPYHQITSGDAWIDDMSHPEYNRHVVVDPENPPAWFEKQKMRHNDFAYHWLVEIRHNADPPVPGAGSAIFFHIRRGTTRSTAGCTTMARSELERMIVWLRAEKKPHYALLTREEFLKRWRAWNLPAPESTGLVPK